MMIYSSTNSWGMMQEILEEEEMRAKERTLKKEEKEALDAKVKKLLAE